MKQKKTFFNAKNIAKLGVLMAIMLLIDITHLGYFTLGPISVTTMHIPVIIGALMGGWPYGLILGLAFGLTSFFHAMSGAAGLMTPFFMNPVISILPRVLFGLFVGWFGKKMEGKNVFMHYALPAFVGTFLHTTLVMGSIYLLYGQRLVEMTGKTIQAVRAMILAVFATNGLPEAVVAVLIASAVLGALEHKHGKKKVEEGMKTTPTY